MNAFFFICQKKTAGEWASGRRGSGRFVRLKQRLLPAAGVCGGEAGRAGAPPQRVREPVTLPPVSNLKFSPTRTPLVVYSSTRLLVYSSTPLLALTD
jgi:hypothetical protein